MNDSLTTLITLIISGGFGSVHRGSLRIGGKTRQVAIKKLAANSQQGNPYPKIARITRITQINLDDFLSNIYVAIIPCL